MSQSFILEYWVDDDWLVGRLKGIPGVFSQGETLAELEENIRDAYQMMNIGILNDQQKLYGHGLPCPPTLEI